MSSAKNVAFTLFITAASLCLPSTAHATHPDWEGEKGIEFQLVLGGGAFTESRDRAFTQVSEDGTRAAFTGGFNARLTAGYRLVPYLSAGVSAGLQTLAATGQYSPAEAVFGPSDSLIAWNVGVWARFYPLSLFDRTQRENPRVFFRDWADRRRLEPWVSVGLDFASGIQRTREYSDSQSRSQWTTTYIGVPLSVGFDYRLTTQLALGLAAGATPMAAASTSRTLQRHDSHTNITTRASVSYPTQSDSNAQLWIGASLRYTLTF